MAAQTNPALAGANPTTTAFTAYAAANPQQDALVTKDRRLAYAELLGHARRLAARLHEQSARPGEPIFVFLENEIDRCTALLASHLAGQAYVPLDSRNPASRLALMLQDPPSGMLLFDRHTVAQAARLASGTLSLISFDDNRGPLSSTWTPAPYEPQALAWIIFTSGSTGRPKGVMQTYRNSTFYVQQAVDCLDLTPATRFAIGSPLVTHASVIMTLAVAVAGGTLYHMEPYKQPAERILDWFAAQQITAVLITPTLFRSMTRSPHASDKLASLRLLRLTGEPVTWGDVALFNQFCGAGCLLHVGYGTTETGGITQAVFKHPAPISRGPVPVGRAQQGVEITLLAENGRPATIIQPGEIVVTSDYLSPGYWQRLDLDKHAFTHSAAGRRQYRTGDMGILRQDGSLEHLGRKDSQLQIHGQRVELAEIEHNLRALPGIEEAAVISRALASGAWRLEAFVTTSGDAAVDPKALRSALAGKLPGYMLPHSITSVGTMPLTDTGKIDRRLLIETSPGNSRGQVTGTEPQGPAEKLLAHLWTEILAVESMDRDSDFFALGGDSLQATRLLARIEELTGRRLAVQQLYESPTPAELAERLDQNAPSAGHSILVPIRPIGHRPPLFAPHGQWGDTLALRHVAAQLTPGIPFYGFESPGLGAGQEAVHSMEAMARLYIETMRTVQPRGPYHLVGYCFGGVLAYEMALQLQAAGETIAALIMIESSTPPVMFTPVPILNRWRLETIRRSVLHWTRRYRARMKQRIGGASRDTTAGRANPKLGSSPDRELWRSPQQHQVREHHRLISRPYRPKPYGGRLVLIRASSRSAGYVLRGPFDPFFGWGKLAAGGVDLRFVDGTHNSILHLPHAATLARELESILGDK